MSPPAFRVSRCVPGAPFHIPGADRLPDLFSGCSANGCSGKGPLLGVPRGSLPIRVQLGIDRCEFWGMTANDAVGSDGAVLLLCSCVRCGTAPAAPAPVPAGQGRGFHLEKIHLVFVLCKETVGVFFGTFRGWATLVSLVSSTRAVHFLLFPSEGEAGASGKIQRSIERFQG